VRVDGQSDVDTPMPETVFTTERPQNQPCQGGSRDDPEMDADAAIVVSAIVQAVAAIATVFLIGLTIRLNIKANRFIEQQARTDLEALYLESVPILEAGLVIGGSFGGPLRWRLLRPLVVDPDTVSLYIRWQNIGKSAAAEPRFRVLLGDDLVEPRWDDPITTLIPGDDPPVTIEFEVDRNAHDEHEIVWRGIFVATYFDLFGNQYETRQGTYEQFKVKRIKEAGSE
jgi:hypothetical protein